jgi:chaperonin GroES
MITRFVPQHDLILVRPLDNEKVGSIFMPAMKRSLPTTIGVVVATGPGGLTITGNRDPMELQVGEKIVVRNGEGDHPEVKVNGEKLILVRFGDVLGSFESD